MPRLDSINALHEVGSLLLFPLSGEAGSAAGPSRQLTCHVGGTSDVPKWNVSSMSMCETDSAGWVREHFSLTVPLGSENGLASQRPIGARGVELCFS